MAKKQSVQVVEARVLPEAALVKTEAATMVSFVTGLVPFFLKAGQLEQQAADASQALVLRWTEAPATKEDDAALMVDIRSLRALAKDAEDHWNPVTSLFSRTHKALTGARGRALDVLKSAVDHGNRHHSNYVEAEQRRAREEAERQRREAEEQARLARERELAALEEQAAKAEADSPDLSARENTFVQVVFSGGTILAAARLAAYKNPLETANRLMATPKIQAALEALETAAANRKQAEGLKTQPLDTVLTEKPAAPELNKGDRTTYSAVILSEEAIIQGVLDGIIPRDVLTVKPARVNEYARSLKEKINAWPGVTLKKTTGVL